MESCFKTIWRTCVVLSYLKGRIVNFIPQHYRMCYWYWVKVLTNWKRSFFVCVSSIFLCKQMPAENNSLELFLSKHNGTTAWSHIKAKITKNIITIPQEIQILQELFWVYVLVFTQKKVHLLCLCRPDKHNKWVTSFCGGGGGEGGGGARTFPAALQRRLSRGDSSAEKGACRLSERRRSVWLSARVSEKRKDCGRIFCFLRAESWAVVETGCAQPSVNSRAACAYVTLRLFFHRSVSPQADIIKHTVSMFATSAALRGLCVLGTLFLLPALGEKVMESGPGMVHELRTTLRTIRNMKQQQFAPLFLPDWWSSVISSSLILTMLCENTYVSCKFKKESHLNSVIVLLMCIWFMIIV